MNGTKQVMVLKGRLLTPLITKKTHFNLLGCRSTIVNPRRRHFTKIDTSKPMYPYSYICYLGTLIVKYEHHSLANINQKLKSLLQMTYLGRYHKDGLGEIQWIGGYIQNKSFQEVHRLKRRKLRIRKGLPLNLTDEQQKLLKYALLHDFYHTSKHNSA